MRVCKGSIFLKFYKITRQLLLAVILAMMTQVNVVAMDDVWGGMGLSEESVQDVPHPSDLFKTQEPSAPTTQAQSNSETPVD